MKTSRRWLFGALFGLLALAGIGLGRAYASGPFFHGFRRHHAPASSTELAEHLAHKVEYVLDGVDASAAQRKQADALVQRLSPEMFRLMNDGRTLRGELKEALLAEQLDKARIDELRARLDAVADRLVDSGMDALVGMSEILTPAQRQRVKERLGRMHL
jgi:Spy/CpxP family protein refolding chaperone